MKKRMRVADVYVIDLKTRNVAPCVPPPLGELIDYGFGQTPFGQTCFIAETGGRICAMAFMDADQEPRQVEALARSWPGALMRPNQHWAQCRLEQLFFDREAPNPVHELLVSGTKFQVEVWRVLLSIPNGETRSYAQVARQVGRTRAMRAVGSAVGANPIAWLIPCHRVLRSDGGLGGYRWGLTVKRALLLREGAVAK